jgi:protein-tyrosine-phosphatase
MNILFVCRFNKFRSKLAEAFFKRHTNRHSAKSAGVIKGSPVNNKIRECALRHNIKVGGTSKNLDVELMRWQDMIVVVADDVPRSLFADNVTRYNRKLMHWKVHDTSDESTSEMDRIAKIIEKKVLGLLAEIDK